MAFTPITVVGTYRTASGAAASGAVTFTPVVAMRNDGIVVSKPVVAQLVSGAISVSLAATDDPGTLPTGVTYLVEEHIDGTVARRRYYLAVPAAGGTIDLDTAAIAEDIPGAITMPVPGPIGPAGANGNTVLNGTTAPSNGLGVNGDFYLRTATSQIYGPKTAGAWGSPTSLIGPAGAAGATGSAGANGRTILNGTTAPSGGLGADGDFYLRTTTSELYGPKTAGAWGSPVSLIGPPGAGSVDSVNGDPGPAVVLNAAAVGAQPADSDLTAIAGLDSSTSGAIASDGSGWIKKTYAQLRASLGLAAVATSGSASDITAGTLPDAVIPAAIARDAEVAAGYQPLSTDLSGIAGLVPSNDDLVQRKAGAWASRTLAQVRADLGLATTAADVAALQTAVTPRGVTPGSILNIGPDVNAITGRNHFAVQVAVDGDPAITTKSTSDVANGYAADPYFVVNPAKTAVQLRASVGGPTTGGSTSARCELREQTAAGVDYGFDALTGTHVLHGRSKITHAPAVTPDIVLAQLHNGSTDRVSFRTQLVSGTWRLRLRVNGSSVTTTLGLDMVTGIANIQNVEFEWKIEVSSNVVKFYLNDMVTPVYTSGANILVSTGSASWYFKTGCYLQATTATDSASDYGAVELRDLWHTHPAWPTPAVLYAVPQHAATHAPGGPDDLSGTYLSIATIDAKGDLLAGTADNTIARVAVGANGRVLAAASGATPGVQWDANPTPAVVPLTDGATVNLDASAGKVFDLTAAGNRTLAAPTNAVDGRSILIRHRASGAARTLTLTTGSAGAFEFGDSPTTLTATASGATDVIGCVYDGTRSRWVVVGVQKGV